MASYVINKRLTTNLVCLVLKIVTNNKRPNQKLIVHPDRCSQYCSHTYYKIIKCYLFISLIISKCNCFDSVLIESFWSRLNNKIVYNHDYKTRFSITNNIIRYIQLYYSQTRTQEGLDYKSPKQIRFNFYCQLA